MDINRRFTVAELEAVSGIGARSLQNYEARGYMQQCGQRSGSGRPRSLSLACVYEAGVIGALGKHGQIALQTAAEIVHADFQMTQFAKALAYVQELSVPFEKALEIAKRDELSVLSKAWLPGPKPTVLWVMVLDEHFGVTKEVCYGWENIAEAVQEVIRKSWVPPLLPMVARNAPAPEQPEPPADFLVHGRPYIHVFNLTAVLAEIDRNIEALP